MRVCKSKKPGGELIFRDNKGKIYFLAKIEKDSGVELEFDKRYLVWVIKENNKVGYVRVTVAGRPLRDHIDNFKNYDDDHYITMGNKFIDKDVIRLHNIMYNNDISFSHESLSYSNELLQHLPAVKRMEDFICKFGINTEQTEFHYGLAALDAYLYELFNIKGFGISKGKPSKV
jgi:hypothetical protein